VAVVALLVFGVSLGIRLTGLELYATTDEGYWMQRSVRFGAALARGDLASTYRAGHPGVSVMWTGLLGIGTERLAPFLPGRYTRYDVLERDRGYLPAFGAARQAVAVVTSGLVTLAVLLAWRLLGLGPGLFGGAILVFDPYVIGMTRLLHVDALLAPLMTVSALAGLIFWLRSRRWPYLLLSAVTGGLALLTKAPAGFLPIWFGLVWLAELWRGGTRPRARSPLPLMAWGVVAAAVYVALFPALWVDPVGRLVSLARFVVLVGLQPHDGNFFLGSPVLEDPGPLYYLVAVPLRLSPLVALGMGLLVLRPPADEHGRAVRWLVLYVALFVALMTLASKKFDRYMLPAQMMLDLLAGVGTWRLAQLIMRKSPTPGPSAARREHRLRCRAQHDSRGPQGRRPLRGRGEEGYAQGDRAVVGELGGIREQIEERLAELGLIGVHAANVVGALDHQRVAVLLNERLDDGLYVLHHLPDIERLQEEVHSAGLDLGEVEDVVDQPEQVLAGRVDPLEVRQGRLVASVLGLFLEHLRVADDRVERRPQFMAHVRQEGGFVLASNFELTVRLLKLLEQPGVLDRDRSLICKRLQERNLLVAERVDLVSEHGKHADGEVVGDQRHRHHRPKPVDGLEWTCIRKVGLDSFDHIVHVNRAPLQERPTWRDARRERQTGKLAERIGVPLLVQRALPSL
jgi:hypothetical protein